jgi:hypothetical protein
MEGSCNWIVTEGVAINQTPLFSGDLWLRKPAPFAYLCRHEKHTHQAAAELVFASTHRPSSVRRKEIRAHGSRRDPTPLTSPARPSELPRVKCHLGF